MGEALRKANIGNDDKIGDNPEATLEATRALREGEADRLFVDRQKVVHAKFERQETLDDAARQASRVGIRGLFRKVIGSGKPVSEFGLEGSAPEGPGAEIIEFPGRPKGDQFEIPGQHKDIAA